VLNTQLNDLFRRVESILEHARWVLAKSILAVVGAIGLIFALVLTDLGLADWHHSKIQT
jgi:hypothetical protein